MNRSSDRVIKSRHKGLSRKEFNREGVSILQGDVGSRRTLLDCREGKGRRRLTGLQPPHTASTEDTHKKILLIRFCLLELSNEMLKMGLLFTS